MNSNIWQFSIICVSITRPRTTRSAIKFRPQLQSMGMVRSPKIDRWSSRSCIRERTLRRLRTATQCLRHRTAMSRSKVTLAASAAATIGWLASGYTGSQVSRFGNGPANLQRATGVSGSTRPFVLSDMIELPKFITSQGRTDPCTHSEIDPCREKSRRNQKGLRNLLGPYSAIELLKGQ